MASQAASTQKRSPSTAPQSLPSAASSTPGDAAPGVVQPALRLTDQKFLEMSRPRTMFLRTPDILVRFRQKMEAEGAVWSEEDRTWYAQQFLAYCLEAEDCDAEMKITNTVDAEPAPWPEFCWTNDYIISSASIGGDHDPPGCNCDDDECNPKTCACMKRHEFLDPWCWSGVEQFAYDKKGRLRSDLGPGSVIFECNDSCACSSSCKNRVVQHGRKVGLDLFKTDNNCGWGLRPLRDVAKGEFVVAYTGELLDHVDSEKRGRMYNELDVAYLLDLDSWHVSVHCKFQPYNLHRVQMGLEPLDINTDRMRRESSEWLKKSSDPVLTVDAGLWGNLARYINHSCDPNLATYAVHYGRRAGHIPQPFLCLFAITDIRAGEELTFSYSGLEDEEAADAAGSQMDLDDDDSDYESSDDDPDEVWKEHTASQRPRTLAPKGFKSQKQRRKVQKVLSATQTEQDRRSKLKGLRAQVCRCGAAKCKKYFWQ
ncbi:hypothetical protein OC835_001882 [Tilletia horrida]|uniref:SET domain-containing protein n=1 Tax=Tilletia horrida TaxID=155126 RepID=A0AAN6GAJ2_9BASI|nr:hypothetical protein OC842_005329 [Tilletia horrida]KAK0536932.1 hypothetical protein OC835_001882 [Tilletia horrida]